MNIPDPIRINSSDICRDGGSYVLLYDSVDGGLLEVELPVITDRTDQTLRRIGYKVPNIRSYDRKTFEAGPREHISWDQAEELRQKLVPLLNTKIGLGGRQRAEEMLTFLHLRGALE